MLETQQDVLKTSYNANFDRLLQLKQKYDPENLFRLIANIEPALRDCGIINSGSC